MSDFNKNPWKTLSSKFVYDNKWINIREYQVINPSGNEGIYGKVHFKNIAVGIVTLDENLNTWLVGQYRYTLDEYSWEIPEGGCLIGTENPLEAAKRELLEETGLIADEWIDLLKTHLSNSVTDEVGYSFVAKKLSQHIAEPEETEDLKVIKLPFNEVLDMVMNGKITDGFSVMSLLKVKLLLDNNAL
jgi:8-oxo-dGTP pyrophosphatase MutT (NUDIX family)